MKLDRNLENVLSFMERNVESRKLLSIAEAIGLLRLFYGQTLENSSGPIRLP